MFGIPNRYWTAIGALLTLAAAIGVPITPDPVLITVSVSLIIISFGLAIHGYHLDAAVHYDANRKRLRERISSYIVEASRMIEKLESGSFEKIDNDIEIWAIKVEQFLRVEFDDSYVDKFRGYWIDDLNIVGAILGMAINPERLKAITFIARRRQFLEDLLDKDATLNSLHQILILPQTSNPKR
ncbi:hypothetical protein JDN40_13010 [Rhodomicrobium vannielii ATCC 17100]|uniref:hypothetical protein n=1 Tax=Rhodomicrobium vannielii TaxID=1069 RepID=UPI00191B303D|nr:hypothetical protein [Rhodomicrobium vannielii]MBJ7535028.1 hypothetical protein [Rhodomicrobium vannielii ATCC 17100]